MHPPLAYHLCNSFVTHTLRFVSPDTTQCGGFHFSHSFLGEGRIQKQCLLEITYKMVKSIIYSMNKQKQH